MSPDARLTARAPGQSTTVVDIGGVAVGGHRIVLIAGPCSVETEAQLDDAARGAMAAGASILRGGAFKPRSSPRAFQGLGEPALDMLARARDRHGLPFVTELLSEADVDRVGRCADAIQIGARNMQNFPLLRLAATTARPVILKRGPSATIEELLLAAECLMMGGCQGVVLCERGIRSFDSSTRNVLDVGAIALLKRITHLPVLADPSHATGKADLVEPAALAAIAAGADGLLVEHHPRPSEALSDAAQQLDAEQLVKLFDRAARVARAVGRTV